MDILYTGTCVKSWCTQCSCLYPFTIYLDFYLKKSPLPYSLTQKTNFLSMYILSGDVLIRVYVVPRPVLGTGSYPHYFRCFQIRHFLHSLHFLIPEDHPPLSSPRFPLHRFTNKNHPVATNRHWLDGHISSCKRPTPYPFLRSPKTLTNPPKPPSLCQNSRSRREMVGRGVCGWGNGKEFLGLDNFMATATCLWWRLGPIVMSRLRDFAVQMGSKDSR